MMGVDWSNIQWQTNTITSIFGWLHDANEWANCGVQFTSNRT